MLDHPSRSPWKNLSCHHFLAFKRFQSLASWSFRLLLGFETSLVLTLHGFWFSTNTCAMLVVKSNLTSSTEINWDMRYAIWVRWNKSTCSILQLMHYISAFTDSHLMDEQNPYMERIEIRHPPACRRQKTINLLDLYPLFNQLHANNQAKSTIQHPPNIIQHHPTWSNIPPNIPRVFVVFRLTSLQPRIKLYSSPSLQSNPQRGHQWPMDPKNLPQG